MRFNTTNLYINIANCVDPDEIAQMSNLIRIWTVW